MREVTKILDEYHQKLINETLPAYSEKMRRRRSVRPERFPTPPRTIRPTRSQLIEPVAKVAKTFGV
ncbi:hypothetical protein RSSM_05571 [Rhodopirellula sallentina SM41]|uniref:Uncharacterized protein n=1 Tax=Rhodopirellula sallentina SM41 TaxID=1263870 RepID=M5U552_9BACT|nr:hypothetical protein RSSM_05571 [Rhodopirellula sallentina SM41]